MPASLERVLLLCSEPTIKLFASVVHYLPTVTASTVAMRLTARIATGFSIITRSVGWCVIKFATLAVTTSDTHVSH